ncbi:MAG: methylmalonyl-CoA mutase [Actinomycetia bacterium]|nr:methylmalonyl-CoA mutase [Actinomycetes bacterium]MCP5030686.1 methylmalonyl-CoA mutase [Actinomycetes bacterium]
MNAATGSKVTTDDYRIRVLLAKPTHDAHDRGVRYIARRMRDAGFEVIFVTFLLAEELVRIAIEEDVDVIGVSSSSHGHMAVFEDLFAGLTAQGIDDVVVIAGGVIGKRDLPTLEAWGLASVFGPGSSAEDAIQFVREHARNHDGSPE